jgi:hypothetical protein
MIPTSAPLRGIVRGRTIELETEIGLPDGQNVTVLVEAITNSSLVPIAKTETQRRWNMAQAEVAHLQPGEGLKRSFGAWADDADELDNYLKVNRQRRKISRPGIEP